MRLWLCGAWALLLCAFGGTAGAADRPHVLLLCVDDLRPELACYGRSYVHSPNIDSLAEAGRLFRRHYVQAPTCGASRYALLTGRYGPAGNGALFQRARLMQQGARSVPESLPGYFRRQGYQTVSVGKVSHHPGGRGGANWNDPGQPELPEAWDRHLMPTGDWQHPRGAMHGLAHGEIRERAGAMAVYQSEPGGDAIYPDGLTTEVALQQLRDLGSRADEQPFLLAVGLIRPHLPFGAPAKYMEPYADAELPPIPHAEKPSGRTTWHGSGEFMKYQRWGRNPNDDAEFATLVRKHYAACVTYADAQVGRIVSELESLGLRDDTVIVLWGDHGWHLGEHAIWGKHALFEESLHSPLIVVAPQVLQAGEASSAIVETIDIFPTLCALTGLERPDGLHGDSLLPHLEDPRLTEGDAVSYARPKTLRTDRYRLIEHPDGYVELYDHNDAAGETRNIAEQNPAVVERLQERLRERLESK